MQVVDWKIIIEKHGSIVWQTAYRLLGNHTDASDCFQETFICAFKVGQKQRIKNFPAFLSKLATTRAIDQLRKRFREAQNNTVNDYKEIVSHKNHDPANYIMKKELTLQLQKELAKLPLTEAQVFCLRYLNDMSYRQIAKELNIDTNTVGVFLYRAKEKLRKSFTALKNNKSEVIL